MFEVGKLRKQLPLQNPGLTGLISTLLTKRLRVASGCLAITNPFSSMLGSTAYFPISRNLFPKSSKMVYSCRTKSFPRFTFSLFSLTPTPLSTQCFSGVTPFLSTANGVSTPSQRTSAINAKLSEIRKESHVHRSMFF